MSANLEQKKSAAANSRTKYAHLGKPLGEERVGVDLHKLRGLEAAVQVNAQLLRQRLAQRRFSCNNLQSAYFTISLFEFIF